MSNRPPPEPRFGDPLPVAASPEMLDRLATRRSASAHLMTGPGPSAEQVEDLLRLGARVPDHGKLAPWRFILLQGEAKADFAARLETMAADRPDAAKAAGALIKLRNPPLAIAVVSRPEPGPIPEWEQVMSAGAVCAHLLLAAGALGFAANWITDWYAFDRRALALLGLSEDEKVAGYIYVGTAPQAPLERARPDLSAITTVWTPPAV